LGAVLTSLLWHITEPEQKNAGKQLESLG
jgi:hypothetical protein